MGTRILLIEDDEGIGSSLAGVLEGQGHEVRWRRGGRDGLAAAADEAPEVVLLDLGLPDLDGVEVCRRLRGAHPGVAIIVVTARGAEVDVVVGLDAGADDYVVKPFRLAELLARLRAQERRLGARRGCGPLRAGGIELDVEARRAVATAGELTLSPKEFDLLSLLVAECGRAVTRERIIELVWDENWYGSTKTLDMHIVALRRKLAAAGETAARITTLRGVGYRLDAG
ncbi:MAG TPA: response regulator transcription factor [Candidatus Dormibacteraeota bacterium]|jgi:DNA-binding response OmpR family regulator|nr:response regulator transcription factor [Candidatus Dormibacteraeota bacterium]